VVDPCSGARVVFRGVKGVLIALALGSFGPLVASSQVHAKSTRDVVRPDFTGSYQHVGGDTEKEASRRAIRTATRGLFPGVRAIARRLLERKLPVAATHSIAVRDAEITIVGDDGVSRTAPDDGRWVTSNGTDGESLEVRHYYRGRSLVQLIVSDRGARQSTYVFHPETGKLLVHVKVVSDELPRDIRYVLTYRRRTVPHDE
jgi:hypothetical protein